MKYGGEYALAGPLGGPADTPPEVVVQAERFKPTGIFLNFAEAASSYWDGTETSSALFAPPNVSKPIMP